MPTPQDILRNYFLAKDANRPHLLDEVFAPTARLEVRNRSTTIAFPAVTEGREAIAEVLVRRFAQTYENVYSFYMQRPAAALPAFCCDWLVCMSDKDSKNVRVGCGRYDWAFLTEAPCLASHLTISIEAMLVLPPALLQPVLAWARGLDYPWSSAAAASQRAPGIEALAPVLDHLCRAGLR